MRPWILRALSITLLVTSIPGWLWVGFNGVTLAIARNTTFPEGILFLCLAAIILQVYFATSLWPEPSVSKPMQRVRWVETRGCMAEERRVQHGVVIREYMGTMSGAFAISEPFVEVRLDDGTLIRFPKGAFLLCGDGVLEYQY
jgi:hypothetical protein